MCSSLVIGCRPSDPKTEENNREVEKFNDTEFYPDQKTAYTKKENIVLFYAPTSDHSLYLATDLNTHLLSTQDPEAMNFTGLLKINDFKYILPKKYADFYKFALGAVGTGGGDFFTHIEFNELGLVKSMERNFPESKNKYWYQYNKYGQLLKLIEDKLLDKVLLENRYDEKSRLVFQKQNDEDFKSERTWVYDNNNRVQKETAWEKEIAPNGNVIKDETKTFFYEYNNLGQLIKKYTQNGNDVIEYTYNLEHKLVNTLKYSGIIDKDHPEKIINHFVKKTYAYLKDEVVEAISYDYRITNSSVLIKGKWEAISIEEQKKYAWEKLKDQSAIPLQIIGTKYTYEPSGINIVTHKYSINNGQKGQSKQLVDLDSMRYILDRGGRIIKKETYNTDAKEMDVQEIFY
ncbi:YD repeat protein [Chryseobacterium sp. StRB126]|nr:YD repeat protein [Chryseobacterium sp. StRB126]